jgi:uncharacterized protein with FMN-binding domain
MNMKIIAIIFLAFTSLFPGQDDHLQLDETARKKMDKTVMSTFGIENFFLEPYKSSGGSTFASTGIENTGKCFQILHDDQIKGLMYIGSAKGRYDWFDFMILYNPDLVIEKVEILVYRSDHGFEIMNKRWLEQFKGSSGCDFEYGKNIDAISGATLSANSLTKAIQEACRKIQE